MTDDNSIALLDHIYELATSTEQQRTRALDEHDYNAIDFDRYDDV